MPLNENPITKENRHIFNFSNTKFWTNPSFNDLFILGSRWICITSFNYCMERRTLILSKQIFGSVWVDVTERAEITEKSQMSSRCIPFGHSPFSGITIYHSDEGARRRVMEAGHAASGKHGVYCVNLQRVQWQSLLSPWHHEEISLNTINGSSLSIYLFFFTHICGKCDVFERCRGKQAGFQNEEALCKHGCLLCFWYI